MGFCTRDGNSGTVHELSNLKFFPTLFCSNIWLRGLQSLQNIFAFGVSYVANILLLLKLQSLVLCLPSIISAGVTLVILLLTVVHKEAEESRFS